MNQSLGFNGKEHDRIDAIPEEVRDAFQFAGVFANIDTIFLAMIPLVLLGRND